MTRSRWRASDPYPAGLWRVMARNITARPAFWSWLRHRLDPAVHGGLEGRGVHTALLRLEELFRDSHAVATLDIRKAFDYVDPDFACDCLGAAGLDQDLVRATRCLWCGQVR